MPSELQAFRVNGATIHVTANTSGNLPTPAQATTPATLNQQYVITNIGSVPAFVGYGPTAAAASANSVVPSTAPFPSNLIPLLANTQVCISADPNMYFCAITSASTTEIYVMPGVGR